MAPRIKGCRISVPNFYPLDSELAPKIKKEAKSVPTSNPFIAELAPKDRESAKSVPEPPTPRKKPPPLRGRGPHPLHHNKKYFNTNTPANTYISGDISFPRPDSRRSTTYEMIPSEIPSEIE